MKRILFLLLPFLPYLASAQVAKDTVTVLTLAQIPEGAIRDTTNLTFVQDNAFAKANFDSLAKYTRVKLQTYTLDSTHITASGLNLQGTRFTGVLPVSRGGTGLTTLTDANRIPYATSATALTTSTGLTFDGTNFATTGTATATKFIPTDSVATGNGMYLPATNALAFSTNGSERMRITSAGDVGIGNPSPTEKLYVKGGNIITEGVSGGGVYNYLYVISENTDARNWLIGASVNAFGDFSIRQSNAKDSNPLTNGTTRFYINNIGNVGIGTENPSEKLHVDGNARITAMNGINDIGASATGVLQAATSDYNLKNSIEDSNFGLNHILQLRPVTFLYNDQDRKIHSEIPEVGFIAQDVNDVIPNAVSPTGEGTLQLDYRAITATLTKAIQEQQQQIEQLKQRITQLENK